MCSTLCRRQSSKVVWLSIAALGFAAAACADGALGNDSRPNILFCIADDWGSPHASAYGDPAVSTPTFDRLASEGVLFTHAFTASPSCTPSRSAILTGQWHWRLGSCANLHSVFPDALTTYVELLEHGGYATGVTGKHWGPGRLQTPGRPVAGHPAASFREFLSRRPADRPFCFWLGSGDPHRPYDPGSGAASGIDLAAIRVPACFPDDPVVRSDLADYYFEVQRFDALVGDAVAALEAAGLLERTLIVVTGDHGLPFPRGKSHLYDLGVRVPLVIRYPPLISAGRVIDDFVSLSELAPTFLELAGQPVPQEMTGRSLQPLLADRRSGRLDPRRDSVIFGKERHVPSQEAPDMGGYPCRGIRTREFLYIRNFRPDRWPSGTPHYERAAIPGCWYADTDNGPTKTFLIENADRDEAHRRLYELSFGKRPAEELYDLEHDPDQLVNVAGDPAYRQQREALAARLLADLQQTGDPRVVGGAESFDQYEYFGRGPRHPDWERRQRD